MKYLLIHDIHNKVKIADQITELNKGNYDKVIYGGDYFDSFHDNEHMARETAIWLKEKLADKNNIMCLANHDQAYLWKHNAYMSCSGFCGRKAKAIYEILTKEELLQLKLFYRLDNILFAHAGVSKLLLDYMVKKGYSDEFNYDIDTIESKLQEWATKANECASVNYTHPIYEAGYERGGTQSTGGLTWCGFGEYEPIKGIVGIFGHSPVFPNHFGIKLCNEKTKYAQISYPEKESRNLDHLYSYGFGINLDSHLEGYAIYDDFTKIIDIYALSFNVSHNVDQYGRKIIKSEKIWSKDLSIVKP